VGPETAIAHLITLSTHTTYGVPGFIQEAALWALEAGADLEDRIAARRSAAAATSRSRISRGGTRCG
jgi:aspartate/methionine/tyrosine aminotransferase